LVVQHEGKRVEFDWSHQSASAIQWAAFYSDCEHEIKTITEGERITLTYNLYVTEPVGGSIPPSLIVDPKSMSLYSFLEELLVEPGFMTDGVFAICSYSNPEHQANCLKVALWGSFALTLILTHPMRLQCYFREHSRGLILCFTLFSSLLEYKLMSFPWLLMIIMINARKNMVSNPIQHKILGVFSRDSHTPWDY
jgi:hypothetical protein